jgi:hypothetical protein
MWMGHDGTWWSLMMGALALALMLPVAVLANILTPKLQDWWAQRSMVSLSNRIQKLEAELADFKENYEPFGAGFHAERDWPSC